MSRVTRRSFIKTTMTAAAGAGIVSRLPVSTWAKPLGANGDVRVAVVGFRGHGRSHIKAYRDIPGVRVVALCDADRDVLDREVRNFRDRKEKVAAYTDVRKMLEDKDIDAVSTATPNHWHALVTVWSCQAGKDVCVEKPVSHNIWEGGKMVEAARKHKRVVQADLDSRSNEGICDAIAYAQEGNLGKIQLVRGFCYKRRKSMGKVSGPQPVPKSVAYDLWCGPAPKGPLMRKKLHYDWHWVWPTGCGEIGNNGPHQLDICRWALAEKGLPRRVMSIGGRFGYDDDGETPNTHIALFEYDSAPILYEVRGLPTRTGGENLDVYRAVSATGVAMRSGRESPSPNTGVIIQCENGWVDIKGRAAYDNKGKVIKRFERQSIGNHTHFINAVRSRKISDLRTDILQGHLSTCLCHMGNVSHRVGQTASRGEIQERIRGDKDCSEAFERFQEHLARNGVDLKKTPAVLGPCLTMDSKKEQFVGDFSDRANQLVRREYRKPFVIPDKV